MKNHANTLEKLINERSIKKMAEVGVYEGMLSKHLCSHCPSIEEYYAIDQWHVVSGPDFGKYNTFTQDFWDEVYMRACRRMMVYKPMKLIRLPGIKASKLFDHGYFDFVYIDSTHHYQETLDEIKVWLPMVHQGGIIGGHDYRATRPEHQGVKKAVDEIFKKEDIKEGRDMVWYVEIL